jgi:hypothetical protein
VFLTLAAEGYIREANVLFPYCAYITLIKALLAVGTNIIVSLCFMAKEWKLIVE